MEVKYRIKSEFVSEDVAKSYEYGYEKCFFDNDSLIYFLKISKSEVIKLLVYIVRNVSDIEIAVQFRSENFHNVDLRTREDI